MRKATVLVLLTLAMLLGSGSVALAAPPLQFIPYCAERICSTNGIDSSSGTVSAQTGGFTPGGNARVEVPLRAGSYVDIQTIRVTPTGKFEWFFSVDLPSGDLPYGGVGPAGAYNGTVTDLATGRTDKFTFFYSQS